MSNLESLFSLIDSVDDEITFITGYDNPPGAEWLDAFHREFDCLLPEEYQRLILTLGSLYVEADEKIWERPKQYAIGPYWTFQYAFKVLGLGDDIPDMLNLTLATRELRSYESAKIVPFLSEIASSDWYCFDAHGGICFWSHEEGVLPSEEQNCIAVIEEHLRRLVQNKARIKELREQREQKQKERLARKIEARRKRS